LGLIVLREFIRTIYHEVEIHESGAFDGSAHETEILRTPKTSVLLADGECEAT